MLAQASIIGRQHRLMNHNCQDYALTHSPAPGFYFGLVLDGCGGKYREPIATASGSKFKSYPSQNEAGARILGQFIGQWLARHLARQESLDCLPDKLQLAAERFLHGLVEQMGFTETAEKQRFIGTNLLATLLGFAVTPKQGCLFWIGDGFLSHNGEISYLDCGNQPPYLANNLLPLNGNQARQMGRAESAVQGRFFSVTDEPLWLAVATDGWQSEQLAQLERPQSSLQLQRWVNVEARQRGRFEDDGAIAMWVKDDD